MKSKMMFAALTGLVLASSSNAAEKTTTTTAAATVTGECHGMNTCKGTGECGGQGHSCHGMNTCKGQGWVTLSEKDCKAKKGQWKASGDAMPESTPAAPAKNAPKAESKPVKK